MANEFEDAARTRKVVLLIAALHERLPATSTADLAKAAPLIERELWDDIADLAGVRSPSQMTIMQVIRVLRLQAEEDIRTKAKARPGMMSSGQIRENMRTREGARVDLFEGLT